MPYLIDGYNLLWTIFKDDEHFEPVDDAGLVSTLSLYCQDVRDEGEVVFDGIGPPNKRPFKQLAWVDVVFSGQGIEADDVIEDKIALCRSPKKLCVVSSDRRVRNAAQKAKAQACRSDDFWTMVLKRLLRKRGPKEPMGKRHGVTDAETLEWLKQFGLA
ncbi:MAG: NYN domain-containing protein [Planctomycetes bacterium]|nr:NYN domain-containing protein [Planctomycetota bacterium]